MQQNNIIQKAFELAYKWHQNKVRKADGSPYIIHPVMVAIILAQNGFDKETVAAGLSHDLLEDTDCPEGEIIKACGSKVLAIVKAVTNDKDLEDKKDWEKKKIKYIKSVHEGPVEAKAVCVVDKIHNLQCLTEAYNKKGPAIWKKFNRGKEKKLWFERKVLQMLKETWKHPLIKEYEKLILNEAELE